MDRLIVHVEGETEETFVKEVLRRHLISKGYQAVNVRLLGNARQRDHRGGIRPWSSAKRDITRHLREDRGCVATTMVDYYAMPQSGNKAWPGRAIAGTLTLPQKAPTVETALLADIASVMGPSFDQNRFIPFVVMHEFEGLLFSDCRVLSQIIGDPSLTNSLQEIRDQFNSPEEINDSPSTAPSKRIEALFPGYQKIIHGNIAALDIGLDRIRAACPHFSDWLTRLERSV